MADSKEIRKEIEKRLKKVFEKLVGPAKEKAVPQLILQPYRKEHRGY